MGALLRRGLVEESHAVDVAERGGNGLGLAIVGAIARAHGGSAHAAGSTVTLALPAEGARRPDRDPRGGGRS